jgi:hypothetical protein
MKFQFKLEETVLEAYKMLKRALCDNAMAENQISEWFLNSNIMILHLKIVCSSIMPSETTQNKTWRKFRKSSVN